MKVCTACAVQAAQVLRCDKRYVHFETTSMTVYGDDVPPAEPKEPTGPLTMTYG
jgi:hypothetical protein